jgi:hypothetical protein
MNNQNLKERLLEFVKPSYPEMLIDVIDRAGKRELYFTEKKFAALYPMQRYHYLINLVPTGFYESELANTVWFELAPGEQPGECHFAALSLVISLRLSLVIVAALVIGHCRCACH